MGRVIAADLSRRHTVTVADPNPAALAILEKISPSISLLEWDILQEQNAAKKLEPYDLVVSAVPGSIGFSVLQKLVETGKKGVDISFSPENPLSLQAQATQTGAVIAVDCGLAPGLSNLFLGYYLTQAVVEEYTCLVGGLPKERTWPWQYKAPFSVSDVIAEYTRPVHQRRQGERVVLPPLSEIELFYVPGIGTLEAFNTDGLRTLLDTTQVPTLREKTLRYPGHAEYIQVLRESGFFSEAPISIGEASVSPRAFSEALLKKVWKLEEAADWVILQVEMKGQRNGQSIRKEYLLREEGQGGVSAMARTTGYTCAAIASLLLEGKDELSPGIWPPELIAQSSRRYSYIAEYLQARGIQWSEREEPLNK